MGDPLDLSYVSRTWESFGLQVTSSVLVYLPRVYGLCNPRGGTSIVTFLWCCCVRTLPLPSAMETESSSQKGLRPCLHETQ